jgi:parallel beta-helix repeat protein
VKGSALGSSETTDIFYQINWSAEQVAQAIAVALDATFVVDPDDPNVVDDPSIFTVAKVDGGILRIIGHTVTDSGPFALSTELQGDQFGLYYSPVSINLGISDVNARQRGQNNAHEGVYIDDVIVGFAGRGEMVTGHFDPLTQLSTDPPEEPAGVATFTPLPTRDFIDPQRITTGTFQLNVRRGTEYGASVGGSNPLISLFDTFDVNDRHVQGFAIVTLAASALFDGQTFRINGLLGTQTFEFDFDNSVTADHIRVALGAGDDAHTVATKIRDAINNVPAALKFEPKAGVDSESDRVNIFGAIEVDSGPLGLITYDGTGDTLPLGKLQGYTLIRGNTISDSLQAGIVVQPAVTYVDETNFEIGEPGHTYSIANLPVANSAGLVPGISIIDNLIVNAGQSAITFSGSPNTPTKSAVPFGRIVNNTIAQTPFGIQVVNNASPTIINNIIAENGTGIFIDNTSATTVVQATIYKDNDQNLSAPGGFVQTTAIALAAGAPLFVDSTNRNFYLAAGSAAIDSSINTLQERDSLVAVTNSLSILPSPIQAPEHDLYGQLRVDDPTVAPPSGPGFGSNVFKDRGAIERSDVLGPMARLFNPVDNDASLIDQSQVVNKVVVVGKTLKNFEIQLEDGGLGVDDATVTSDKFVIERTIGGTTTTLVPEVDYTLEYEGTSNIVLVTPAAGVWINATYTVNITNSAAGIRDRAGNNLQPNEASGATKFVIQLTDTATSSWQNPNNKYDVNGDGSVFAIDALIIINRILAGMSGPLPPTPVVPPYLDVSGDGNLSPLDVLQVINFLNLQAASLSATPAASTADETADVSAMVAPEAADEVVATAVALVMEPDDSVIAPSAVVADASAIAFSLSTHTTYVDYVGTPVTTSDLSVSSDSNVMPVASSASASSAALSDDVWGDDGWDADDDSWDEIAAEISDQAVEKATLA